MMVVGALSPAFDPGTRSARRTLCRRDYPWLFAGCDERAAKGCEKEAEWQWIGWSFVVSACDGYKHFKYLCGYHLVILGFLGSCFMS
jgi:hypothetical protein